MEGIRSADELVTLFEKNPDRLQSIASSPDPITEFKKVAIEAKSLTQAIYTKDKWIYRMVIITLGVLVVGTAIGAIILATQDKSAPEVLVALGSAAVGAMAGLLAPSPGGR